MKEILQHDNNWRFLYVQKDAIQENGEDSFVLMQIDPITLLCVFDGCGGLGSKKYSNYYNHTAAYIASRMVAAAVVSWFTHNVADLKAEENRTEQSIAAELKTQIDQILCKIRRMLDTEDHGLISSLIRSFPTTAVVALVEPLGEAQWECRFLWAGDSRGYILTVNGLSQYTKDDLRFDGDAFENLYEDSSLSNLVNGDGEYELHTRKVSICEPAVVITATDGMFAYLPSPMHFEWMLLQTMQRADDHEEWMRALNEAVAQVTGDDSTICMRVCGWTSFLEMKQQFEPRYAELSSMLTEAESRERLEEVWLKYKPSYEQMCN